jgi:hypothetical protein
VRYLLSKRVGADIQQTHNGTMKEDPKGLRDVPAGRHRAGRSGDCQDFGAISVLSGAVRVGKEKGSRACCCAAPWSEEETGGPDDEPDLRG